LKREQSIHRSGVRLSVLAGTLGAAVLSQADLAGAAVVFQQDFSAGGAVADYVGSGGNLFDEIAPSGSGVTMSITDNAVQATRGTANAGVLNRTTDLALTDAGIFQFSVNFTSIASTTSPALNFSIGTNYTTGAPSGAAVEPPATDTFARVSISTTDATDTWRVRNSDAYTAPGGGNVAAGSIGPVYSGKQNLFWVVNTGATPVTYTAPDGSTAATGADAWDIWVGATQIMDEHPGLTATQGITDSRFRVSSGTETVQFDDFIVSSIEVPEPASFAVLGAGMMLLAGRRRRRA
jgi:hypothetical protein